MKQQITDTLYTPCLKNVSDTFVNSTDKLQWFLIAFTTREYGNAFGRVCLSVCLCVFVLFVL